MALYDYYFYCFRFYDPLSGCVLLDGVDIRGLQLKWYRSNVGLVSQVGFRVRLGFNN